MNKKKKIIITLAMLSCVVVAFIGGHSYAKYVSKVEGNGTAEIATWNFTVNKQTEQMQQIQLATSTSSSQTVLKNKIAPGTGGSFLIIIDAKGSEVGINYSVQFEEETTKPTNMKFRYQGETCDNLKDLESKLCGFIPASIDDEQKKKTLEIEWFWPYNTGNQPEEITANDIIDTQDALNISNYKFNVIVSGIQAEPQ